MARAVSEGRRLDFSRIKLLVDRGRYRLYEDRDRQLWFIEVTRSRAGNRLKTPVECWINPLPGKLGLKLVDYVVSSLSRSLIPFTLKSRSLMKLVAFLYRFKNGSNDTLRTYTHVIRRFMRWYRGQADRLIDSCFTGEGLPDQRAIHNLAQTIDQYLAELQAEDLSSQTIASVKAALKTWLGVNGITLPKILTPMIRHSYSARAPTPDELAKVLEIADLREKVIISVLALSGIRVGTLIKLKLKHLEPDLSRGVTPLCITVPAELNKGHYCSYFTFIGAEAVQYLRLYLEERRRGTRRVPAEKLTPESPLIRARCASKVKLVSKRSVYHAVQKLFRKAGLLKEARLGKRYQLCVHSLRKYFKTQLTARGVPTEFVEFMMGHKTSTYLDVKSKGVEFLRSLYAASGISIKSQTRLSRIEVLKEIVRALGFNPEEVLVKRVLKRPHRTEVASEQLEALREAIRQAIRREVLELKQAKGFYNYSQDRL